MYGWRAGCKDGDSLDDVYQSKMGEYWWMID